MGARTVQLMPLRLRAAGLTDIGCVRERNEDAFLADEATGLFIVADGMGGRNGGEVAARRLVELLPEIIRRRMRDEATADRNDTQVMRTMLEEAVMEASGAIRAEGEATLENLGMGAAVIAALVVGSHAHIAHMGDSRAYLFREGGLRQLTHDHSIVEALLRNGEISPQEAVDHPARGRLTRFAGMEPAIGPATQTVDLLAGDRLMLCTDGLWGLVGDRALAGILSCSDGCEATCRVLIAAGKAAGGEDNLTAVVVDVEEGLTA
jgi:protein phosphatase